MHGWWDTGKKIMIRPIISSGWMGTKTDGCLTLDRIEGCFSPSDLSVEL